MLNLPMVQLLTATIIAAVIGIGGFLFGSAVISTPVSVTLEPKEGLLVLGETFTVSIIIEANLPVNVYKGLLVFDPEILTVTSINYNTSIANLWAEEPWYSNGEGSINFTGGTTNSGGFTGRGHLITVTFTAKNPGEARLVMEEMRVLQHDGLGTDVPLTSPIDALFAVAPIEIEKQTVFKDHFNGPAITIIPETPNTDLNNDGQQTMADVSIFMTHLLSQDALSDFNQDGKVNLKDLSILNHR